LQTTLTVRTQKAERPARLRAAYSAPASARVSRQVRGARCAGFVGRCERTGFLARCAWKVQRICIWDTDSLTKSGKSTDSFTLLGKNYRFFEEIRRVKDRLRGPKFWAWKLYYVWAILLRHGEKNRQNHSDLVHFSGKSFRHGEKIRLAPGVRWLRAAYSAPASARVSRPAHDPGSYRQPGEKLTSLAAFTHKKPGIHTK